MIGTKKVNYFQIDPPGRVSRIMDFEGGEISPRCIIELFSNLIGTGLAWSLQGMYGRQANRFIEASLLTKEGEITQKAKDEYWEE